MFASAPTPLRPACSNERGLEQACQSRGCGFCSGFGVSVKSWIAKSSLCQSTCSCVQRRGNQLERLLHLLAGLLALDVEGAPLRDRGAGEAELEAAAAEVIEEGGALGDADRVVEAVRREHRGVAHA